MFSAYLLLAMVTEAMIGEDACATRTGWDRDEGNGMLTSQVSFFPPGKACRWMDANGVEREVVLTPW